MVSVWSRLICRVRDLGRPARRRRRFLGTFYLFSWDNNSARTCGHAITPCRLRPTDSGHGTVRACRRQPGLVLPPSSLPEVVCV